MKLVGDVSLIVVTFLATFYFTVWVGLALLEAYRPYDSPPEWLWAAVPTFFGVLTSVFVWSQSGPTEGLLTTVATGVWVCYLTTGGVLAVTRVALFVWLVDQQTKKHMYTEINQFMFNYLYPEFVFGLFWRSLVAVYGTAYYLAWGMLVTVGSFVMATPILLVAWLRQRRMTSLLSR
jgi:hypothetical protein